MCAWWPCTQPITSSSVGVQGICLGAKGGSTQGLGGQGYFGRLLHRVFKTKVGYRVLLGDTVITSVHVLFDESIPVLSADYFRELDEATVKSVTLKRG